MPELPVKEGRLSELHLPEIKRDDIVRSLSEIRMPDVDLKFDLPKIDLPTASPSSSGPTLARRSPTPPRQPVSDAAVATALAAGRRWPHRGRTGRLGDRHERRPAH